jgi:broad specificity phosphatase PhoE
MTIGSGAITLHLVRHGETADNAERRFQMPEVPLSDNGRDQARALAAMMRNAVRAQLVLASDYARAFETAGIIAEALGVPILPEPALRERNFGIARGQLYADIAEETQASWRQPRVRIEGGENWADVFERVETFLAKLRQAPPATKLVLVTHGGTMNVILRHLEGCAIDDFQLAPLENCALRTVKLAC